MSDTLQNNIKEICESVGNDRTRLMDIVIELQKREGCITGEAMNIIAEQVGAHRVEVEGVVSFYAFLSENQKGNVIVRICNDVVDVMKGYDEVKKAFEEELGIKCGETTSDGKITLENTPCMGMSDQAPAALVNDVVVTNLNADKARKIASQIKQDTDVSKLVTEVGDGNNANELVKAMVKNNIQKTGEVILADREANAGLKKALEMSPEDIISEVKNSKVRGRGGAGFPTGMKWEFTRGAKGDKKYVLCNADEGEPGTFKDRVILTEKADMVFEGMTIGGYAIGADEGILYLRGEYAYLRKLLESVLKARRDAGLLGKNVCGKEGFDFDIRIQSGAGAYICGEESALISSCEGLRGDPKTRPPFPAQKGYLAKPTTVNNVETFCCVARIMEKGAVWFSSLGSKASTGTKMLSISGDCEKQGVYEFPFGITVQQMLDEVGAKDTQAVLVAGPSGQIISSSDFGRTICYDDLATGGAIVIFNSSRNIIEIAKQYMEFFVEESCGFCTPCRAGNVLLLKKLEEILEGKGEAADLDYLKDLGESVKFMSRCGLGQTSPNPILTTLKNFRPLYEALVKPNEEKLNLSFNIREALKDGERDQGRESVVYPAK